MQFTKPKGIRLPASGNEPNLVEWEAYLRPAGRARIDELGARVEQDYEARIQEIENMEPEAQIEALKALVAELEELLGS